MMARRSRADGEEGYILIAVLLMVVMVLIALSVAAPKVAADIQRDREVETIHRGQQYVRAIKLYYKKFGAYPPNMDALEKSNEIRFLRKRYKDPMTGKDDWHLIHFGENKTPSMGFFGQPLSGAGGSTLAGVGPAGQSGATGGGLFDSSTTDPNAGSSTATTASGSTDPGSTGTGTDPTTGLTPTGGAVAPNSGFGSSTNASGGSTGLTVGGLGIIGVESTSPKLGILVWKKKTHYNEWEFWYDPNADRMMISNNTGAVGQPMGTSTNTGTGTNGGIEGNSGFGGGINGGGANGGSDGTTGQQPPSTPQPQQQ